LAVSLHRSGLQPRPIAESAGAACLIRRDVAIALPSGDQLTIEGTFGQTWKSH
jgi:hypothetical protein